jgi:hypothetical protein
MAVLALDPSYQIGVTSSDKIFPAPRAVQHSEDPQSLWGFVVKDQVAADGHAAEPDAIAVLGRAETRMFAQQLNRLVQSPDHGVGRLETIGSDVSPNLQDVFLGLAGP